jgi:polyisoprenoid-binding protein YceI
LIKEDYLGSSTYVGHFNSFDASLSFDSNSIEASQLQATADTRSLDINDEN